MTEIRADRRDRPGPDRPSSVHDRRGVTAFVFSSGWASGVNAYLRGAGARDRRPHSATSPRSPTCWARWDVLAVAGFMYAMEFVADKIPYIDSSWDAVSTAIRPTAGAVIGVLLAGDATTLEQAVLGVVGGGTALLSHLGQGRQPAGDQLLPRAGHQRRGQRDRGRRRAGRGVVRDRPPARRRRRSRLCCSSSAWSCSTLVARLIRRGLAPLEEEGPAPGRRPRGLPARLGFPRGAGGGGRRWPRRAGRGRAAGQARPRGHPRRALGAPSAARWSPVVADGFGWDAGPSSTLLPAVLRDLFRKSGRPARARARAGAAREVVREHRFDDGSTIRLPGGSRAAQLRAVDAARARAGAAVGRPRRLAGRRLGAAAP